MINSKVFPSMDIANGSVNCSRYLLRRRMVNQNRLSCSRFRICPIHRREDAAEIDAFNAVAQEESEAAGVHYFDIPPMTRPSIYDAGLFADDGLHPSAKMYTLWVEMILPKVNDLFRDDPTENVTSSG